MSTTLGVRRVERGPALALALPRAGFVALLAVGVCVPHTRLWVFPQVADVWSLLPFGGLVLVALVDVRRPWQLAHLDLLALLSLILAIEFAGPQRPWSMLLLYPQLAYLAVRMLVLARGSQRPLAGLRPQLPLRWLIGGLVVVVAVHIGWASQRAILMDVGADSVKGALRIIHLRPLYSGTAGSATYGPANFLAYVPFAALTANANTAARLATVVFTMTTAALLFALGRRERGVETGVLLAFCWLALPFTLYEDATGFNDSLVAATLVASLLCIERPARCGVAAAVSGWTKLAPLALVPLLAARRTRRELQRFAVAFTLSSALLFIPALARSTPADFIAQTFGYQTSRTQWNTIWVALAQSWSSGAHWLTPVSGVLHALVLGAAGATALLMARGRTRADIGGVAAASAGVLLLFQLSLNSYAYSYILWFAPLLLIALVFGHSPPRTAESAPSPDRVPGASAGELALRPPRSGSRLLAR